MILSSESNNIPYLESLDLWLIMLLNHGSCISPWYSKLVEYFHQKNAAIKLFDSIFKIFKVYHLIEIKMIVSKLQISIARYLNAWYQLGM